MAAALPQIIFKDSWLLPKSCLAEGEKDTLDIMANFPT